MIANSSTVHTIDDDEQTLDEIPADGGPIRARRIYDAEEHEAIDVPLAHLMEGDRLQLYPEVTGKGYFQVFSKDERPVFQAGGHIGLIPINSRVAIDVRPRAAIRDNLERIILKAEHTPTSLAPHLRFYSSHEVENPALLDLFAQALLTSLAEIQAQGLYREYHQHVGNTSFPRGRVLLGETVRRHLRRGVHHRVTASWFEPSVDTGPNRTLKFAIWYLAARFNVTRSSRRGVKKLLSDLNRAYRLFDAVELDRSRKFLEHPIVVDPSRLPTIRAYYRNALNLAVSIIRDRGVTFEGRGDDILMASLLINMEKVFESYLRSVLKANLADLAPRIQILNGNKAGINGGKKLLFDQPPSDHVTPDIVIRDLNPPGEEPEFPVLIDAKYKRVRNAPDRSDLNQVIAYAASYRSPIAVIAHPREGTAQRVRMLGKIGELSLYQYGFDLGATDLDREERDFALMVRSLCSLEPSRLH